MEIDTGLLLLLLLLQKHTFVIKTEGTKGNENLFVLYKTIIYEKPTDRQR